MVVEYASIALVAMDVVCQNAAGGTHDTQNMVPTPSSTCPNAPLEIKLQNPSLKISTLKPQFNRGRLHFSLLCPSRALALPLELVLPMKKTTSG